MSKERCGGAESHANKTQKRDESCEHENHECEGGDVDESDGDSKYDKTDADERNDGRGKECEKRGGIEDAMQECGEKKEKKDGVDNGDALNIREAPGFAKGINKELKARIKGRVAT